MSSLFAALTSFPAVVYTVLLGVVLVYWLLAIIGLVDFEAGADMDIGADAADAGDAGDIGDAGDGGPEGLSGLAAWLHAHPERVAVGVDLNVTHLRAVASGRVTGRAVPVRLGNGTLVHTVDVYDDEGRLTAIGRLTSQLLAPKK